MDGPFSTEWDSRPRRLTRRGHPEVLPAMVHRKDRVLVCVEVQCFQGDLVSLHILITKNYSEFKELLELPMCVSRIKRLC
jgi:hypothetical protein